MIDIQEYIDSGILEFYVYGKLSKEESIEISRLVVLHPELKSEVERIEQTQQKYTSTVVAETSSSFTQIRSRVLSEEESNAIPLSRKRIPLDNYFKWGAIVFLLAVMGYQFIQNEKLKEIITTLEREQLLHQGKIDMIEEELVKANELLEVFRTKNIVTVPLVPQKVTPDAYASIYWNKETEKAYIDVRGLPRPPEGKVYQLWSLTLDSLTSAHIAVLDQYDTRGTQLFEVTNPNTNISEAFGVTLEPKGGSAFPNLEQLYVLGTVAP